MYLKNICPKDVDIHINNIGRSCGKLLCEGSTWPAQSYLLLCKGDLYTGRLSCANYFSSKYSRSKFWLLSQEDIFEAVSGCLKKLVENMRVGDPFAAKVPATILYFSDSSRENNSI